MAAPAGWTQRAGRGGSAIVRRKELTEIEDTGYVARILEAALLAFDHTGSFEEGALAAKKSGIDTAKTGAVYGLIAEAFYRVSEIPER